jgi:hypothetical protein
MNSTLSLSFRYSQKDYVRAMRAHCASRLRLRLDVTVVVLVVVVGGWLWRMPNLHWLGIVCIVVSAVFILMLAAVFTVVPLIAFRREPKFRDNYSLTFSPEGIHFQTAHIDSRLQWSTYSRTLIDAHSYVLYYGPNRFTIIPKRVFENTAQQEAFEQLLKDRIPKIIRRGA